MIKNKLLFVEFYNNHFLKKRKSWRLEIEFFNILISRQVAELKFESILIMVLISNRTNVKNVRTLIKIGLMQVQIRCEIPKRRYCHPLKIGTL